VWMSREEFVCRLVMPVGASESDADTEAEVDNALKVAHRTSDMEDGVYVDCRTWAILKRVIPGSNSQGRDSTSPRSFTTSSSTGYHRVADRLLEKCCGKACCSPLDIRSRLPWCIVLP